MVDSWHDKMRAGGKAWCSGESGSSTMDEIGWVTLDSPDRLPTQVISMIAMVTHD